jgi:NitT/TauT family transport system substrate-binding protein
MPNRVPSRAPSRPSSRRQFLRRAGAALAAAPLAHPVLAQTKLRDVSMRLDWVFQGPNAGFMVAHAKGFYKDAGLNVDVGPGKGSGSTAQLVASKAAQFGFADGFVVGNSVSKGLNIRAVAAVYRRNPTAVTVLADSGIKSPKDLEGKSIAITPGSAQFQQWPAFVKGCKLDADKIRVVSVDPAGTPPALITGKVQAMAGFAQGQVPTVEIRGGKQVRLFWYADCGVNAVSNSIIVHNDLIKEDPALIKAFVAATIKGFLYGRAHPDELVAAVKTFSPMVDPAVTRREAELSWQTWVTPATAGKALGWMAEKDWQETVEVLKQYGGVSRALEAARLYTNDFVPTGPEFLPPPAETKKT